MNEQFTKKQLAEIVLWFASEGDPEDYDIDDVTEKWAEDNVKCIEEGNDVVEHKTVYNSNIYLVEGIHFEVTFTRDNSGYWGDGERYDPEIYEVFPTQVTKTVYVHEKPQ